MTVTQTALMSVCQTRGLKMKIIHTLTEQNCPNSDDQHTAMEVAGGVKQCTFIVSVGGLCNPDIYRRHKCCECRGARYPCLWCLLRILSEQGRQFSRI